MKIKCIHGYFIFEETEVGQIARFNSIFGLGVVPNDDHYTFPFLVDAPEHSFDGSTYLGAAATETFAGKPWEVMRTNELIYDFNSGSVKQISSVSTKANLVETGFYFTSSGLLMPGSFRDDGKRVTDYTAWFIFSSMKFRYTEVVYED